MKTANGLRVGCLGGIYDDTVYNSCEMPPVRMIIFHVSFFMDFMTLGILFAIFCHTNNRKTPFQYPFQNYFPKLPISCFYSVSRK